jgi:hypothetical protein
LLVEVVVRVEDLHLYVAEQRIVTMVHLAAIPTGKADKVALKLLEVLVVHLGLERLQEVLLEPLEMVAKLVYGRLRLVVVVVVDITAAAAVEMMDAAQELMVVVAAEQDLRLFLLAVHA